MIGKAGLSASTLRALAIKGMRRLALHATLTSHLVLAQFGHQDYVRFLVLTRSRTGSNLLLSFLNSHPKVFCEGEIFATMRSMDPLLRLRKTFGKQPRHISAKGFKIFYYHPLDATGEALWRELERRTEIRVIHLTRENILRTLLSRKIAGIKGSWTGTRFDASDPAGKRVSFTTQELERGFSQTREWEEAAARRFREHQVAHVTYEDLVRDPQAVSRQILEFLGLPAGTSRTGLRQQNPESLRELIGNYAELKAAFAGSVWARFFEE